MGKSQSLIQRGGGGGGGGGGVGGGGFPGISPPSILKSYDAISLRDEKIAVIVHTSDGNLGAVSYMYV